MNNIRCVFSLFLALIITLSLPSCGMLTAGAFEASPVDYFGYLQDETPDCITFSGEMLSSASCRLTAFNSGKDDFYFDYQYGLYKLVKGEWLPVKKCAEESGANSYYFDDPFIEPGGECKYVYDWSYEYGVLDKGSYKLVTYMNNASVRPTVSYVISWNFDIPVQYIAGEEADSYGYCGKSSEPEDLTMTAEKISPSRLRLTIKGVRTKKYVFDNTWALYKKSGGEWVPVTPEAGQAALCYKRNSPRYTKDFTVVLSSIYGSLDAGDYLIVKRCLPSGNNLVKAREEWQSFSASEFNYISAEFRLDSDITAPDFVTEPLDSYSYYKDSPELSVIDTSTENVTASGCTLVLKNSGDKTFSLGNEDEPSYICKLFGGEWLPVKVRLQQASPLLGAELRPYSEIKLDVNWSLMYGSLSPGTYRLIRYISVQYGKAYTKSFEFTVTEAMADAGENPFGYSAEAETAAGYTMTAEKLGSHRYMLTISHDEAYKGYSIYQSFALYMESGGEWLPLPCKYKTDDYYYVEGDKYYYCGGKNFIYSGSQIVDIAALYPNLKPGSYRLVKRCGWPGKYKYVTVDIDYKA